MSTVNNWMILSGAPLDVESEDDEALPEPVKFLNRLLLVEYGFQPGPGFARVDHLAGGDKALEADVFLLAESHGVDEDVMLSLMKLSPWGHAARIQIFLKTQEEAHWRQVAAMFPGTREKLSL